MKNETRFWKFVFEHSTLQTTCIYVSTYFERIVNTYHDYFNDWTQIVINKSAEIVSRSAQNSEMILRQGNIFL